MKLAFNGTVSDNFFVFVTGGFRFIQVLEVWILRTLRSSALHTFYANDRFSLCPGLILFGLRSRDFEHLREYVAITDSAFSRSLREGRQCCSGRLT